MVFQLPEEGKKKKRKTVEGDIQITIVNRDTVKTCIKEQDSGLRTLRLKFGQKSTIYIRTHSA